MKRISMFLVLLFVVLYAQAIDFLSPRNLHPSYKNIAMQTIIMEDARTAYLFAGKESYYLYDEEEITAAAEKYLTIPYEQARAELDKEIIPALRKCINVIVAMRKEHVYDFDRDGSSNTDLDIAMSLFYYNGGKEADFDMHVWKQEGVQDGKKVYWSYYVYKWDGQYADISPEFLWYEGSANEGSKTSVYDFCIHSFTDKKLVEGTIVDITPFVLKHIPSAG